MDRFIVRTLFITALVLGLFVLYVALSSSRAVVDAYTALDAAPRSAFDMAMESRGTPPDDGRGGVWLGLVGLLLASGVVLLALFAAMRGWAGALRERRLSARRAVRPTRQAVAPRAPYAPSLADPRTVAPPARAAVPTVRSDDDDDYLYHL